MEDDGERKPKVKMKDGKVDSQRRARLQLQDLRKTDLTGTSVLKATLSNEEKLKEFFAVTIALPIS